MELLVCVADAGTVAKPGDVIDFRPDGWPWSQAERAMPNWRIVRADITPIEAEALTRLDVQALPDVLTRADLDARASGPPAPSAPAAPIRRSLRGGLRARPTW